MSVVESDAWPSCQGTGTIDDPYRGTFIIDNGDGSGQGYSSALRALDGSYVAVGTKFVTYGVPSMTQTGTYTLTGPGLSWDDYHWGITGTLTEPGLVDISYTDGPDRHHACSFESIEFVEMPELVFMYNPSTDGVIEYVA